MWSDERLYPKRNIKETGGVDRACDFIVFFLFLKNYLFIYLFLAALGFRCCARAFSSCGE